MRAHSRIAPDSPVERSAAGREDRKDGVRGAGVSAGGRELRARDRISAASREACIDGGEANREMVSGSRPEAVLSSARCV